MKTGVNTKVCIAGKNEIAVYGLELLADKINKDDLTFITNESDEGYDTWQPSLRKKAAESGIQESSLENCYEIVNLAFISLEFDRIIDPEKFRSADLYNIHFSALPAYKGMYTSALPLMYNEKESGVTLHKIDSGIDTGPIIDQQIFDISELDTARELYNEYLEYSKGLLSRWIDKLLSGNIGSTKQSAHGSSYYSKKTIDYSKLVIDFTATAQQIKNQVRAYTFPEFQVPSVYDYKVNRAEITPCRSSSKAGNIVDVSSGELRVATIDYDIILKRDKTAELFDSASRNDPALAIECLTNGAKINWRNGNGWTPLIVASYSGSLAVIDLLIRAGANINQANYKGTTPIMYAMSNFEITGSTKSFDLLYDHGADFDLMDNYGKSLVHYADERMVSGLNQLNHYAIKS